MPASDVFTPANPNCADGIAAEKAEVQAYFNSIGFEHWNRIYSDSSEVNRVQRNIRIGHQKTVDNVLNWLQEQGNLAGRSFCDAGCGVGSLSLPLAQLQACQPVDVLERNGRRGAPVHPQRLGDLTKAQLLQHRSGLGIGGRCINEHHSGMAAQQPV